MTLVCAMHVYFHKMLFPMLLKLHHCNHSNQMIMRGPKNYWEFQPFQILALLEIMVLPIYRVMMEEILMLIFYILI